MPARAASAMLLLLSTAAAAPRQVDVGPLTPYGEMPAEAANKRLVFEWIDEAIVQGHPAEAFKRFVSPAFREHSHLLPAGSGYRVALRRMEQLAAAYRAGRTLPLPTMASVNGPVVTMYGGTLDAYRVVDGRITEHWDVTPPREITIKEHPPGTAERVMSDAPPPGGPPLTAADLTPPPGSDVLRSPVDLGPTPPQGETPQERRNKRLTIEQGVMSWVQNNFPAAFRTYVSPDFRNYSHLITRGKKPWGGYDETLKNISVARARMMKNEHMMTIDIPHQATANGQMVAMFGEGVDLDEVVGGKNVAHYDASPPARVTLRPHDGRGYFLP